MTRGEDTPALDPALIARYAHLVARGQILLKAATTADLHQMPTYELPDDAPDPLEVLLAEREADDR
ncbi:hypothetical protein ABZW47_15990 [Streptomyces sp. NPDC004549]|uniref:hypothetical protein n=1 Tax=Streptomyces sp. NPDC004549 TaxID=3154283 RepID=UPI0033A8AF30